MNCPFCNSDIKQIAFSESDHFLAIYDIAPILPGHSLIIPKRHLQSIHDLTIEQYTEFFLFARDVIRKLSLVFNAPAFDWIIQENEEAGQSIPHLHLHIILRTKNDLPDAGDWYTVLKNRKNEEIIDSKKRPRLSFEQLKTIAQKLKDSFHELDKK